MNTKTNRFLEILRWIGVFLGIFFAFLWGTGPLQQFSVFAIFTIIFVAGLTGIEGLFFGRSAVKVSGYDQGSAYQRQSAFNNLALAITAVLALLLGWGFYAYVGLLMVLLIFLTFSAINHFYTGMKDKFVLNTLLRPILVVLLWFMSLYFLLPALGTV
jgi:hypothetical protein